jgi:predicted anti-sigma-YlaC factor YlaD
MDCDSTRVAISASLDGENPGVPDEIVRAHLDECEACRAWRERAHALTRRARLGGYVLDHDLAPRVLAAVPANPPRRPARRAWFRSALAVVAVAQLAITVPLLILGHDHGAGAHAAHELGSFDLALAIAFVVGAVRPKLSAGLAWPCCVAALGLAGTAVADLITGATFGADEAQHLVAIVGALLLFWQARTESAGVEESGGAALVPPSHEVSGDVRDSLREVGAVRGPAARQEHAA